MTCIFTPKIMLHCSALVSKFTSVYEITMDAKNVSFVFIFKNRASNSYSKKGERDFTII